MIVSMVSGIIECGHSLRVAVPMSRRAGRARLKQLSLTLICDPNDMLFVQTSPGFAGSLELGDVTCDVRFIAGCRSKLVKAGGPSSQKECCAPKRRKEAS